MAATWCGDLNFNTPEGSKTMLKNDAALRHPQWVPEWVVFWILLGDPRTGFRIWIWLGCWMKYIKDFCELNDTAELRGARHARSNKEMIFYPLEPQPLSWVRVALDCDSHV
jgi:hypothetical protein